MLLLVFNHTCPYKETSTLCSISIVNLESQRNHTRRSAQKESIGSPVIRVLLALVEENSWTWPAEDNCANAISVGQLLGNFMYYLLISADIFSIIFSLLAFSM